MRTCEKFYHVKKALTWETYLIVHGYHLELKEINLFFTGNDSK
jgi:hypothetical protein